MILAKKSFGPHVLKHHSEQGEYLMLNLNQKQLAPD